MTSLIHNDTFSASMLMTHNYKDIMHSVLVSDNNVSLFHFVISELCISL
jgi:hypothetical protein